MEEVESKIESNTGFKISVFNSFIIAVLLIVFIISIGVAVDELFNTIKINYVTETILELIITFSCWSIFLLLIYTYLGTENLNLLSIAISFLFAGVMNLIHALMVFNNNFLVYHSSSELFAVSTRLIILIGILISWLIKDKKYNGKYDMILTTILSGLFSLTIIYTLLKMWSQFTNIVIITKIVILVLIVTSIIFYYKRFELNNKKSDLLLIKGFMFLLISELLSFFGVDIFSVEYFISHLFKLAFFIYLLRSIFGQEVVNGILAQEQVKLDNIKLNLQQDKIQDLRSQRHDFKNELQTIYTMLQLNKNKEVLKYIKELHFDLDNINYGTEKNSTLSSVLLPKKKKANEHNIEFKKEIDVCLEKIAIPQNKFLKIVFNLIDNAFDAVTELAKEKRKVTVKLIKEQDLIKLVVHNSGPLINKDKLNKIFTPGFSTKGEDRGFGLYIVKNLVEDFGGRIVVKSKPEIGTKFICYLPSIDVYRNNN